jgi:hypothetical protein
VDERERQIETALHASRVTGDLAVSGVREPDPVEELLGACGALVLADALKRGLEP